MTQRVKKRPREHREVTSTPQKTSARRSHLNLDLVDKRGAKKRGKRKTGRRHPKGEARSKSTVGLGGGLRGE